MLVYIHCLAKTRPMEDELRNQIAQLRQEIGQQLLKLDVQRQQLDRFEARFVQVEQLQKDQGDTKQLQQNLREFENKLSKLQVEGERHFARQHAEVYRWIGVTLMVSLLSGLLALISVFIP